MVGPSEPVAQLLGKKGSIAVGALAGTVLPVIGNIIGGYIGYRLWRSRHRRGEQRDAAADTVLAPDEEVVRPMRDKSPEKLEAEEREAREAAEQLAAYRRKRYGPDVASRNPNALSSFIAEVRGLYKSGQYRKALGALTDRDRVAAFGVTLRQQETRVTLAPDFDARAVAAEFAEVNMYFPADSTIRLASPTFTAGDGGPASIEDAPAFGRYLLPMFIEEYVHALQHWTSRHFAQHTDTFAEETGAGQDPMQDMDEVDVMALFHEWGFDVEAIDYVERYAERKAYWEWLQSRRVVQ